MLNNIDATKNNKPDIFGITSPYWKIKLSFWIRGIFSTVDEKDYSPWVATLAK